jgi:release factor glutamine methyltransferase
VTLGEALRTSAEHLERAGIDSPRLDAERILAHALRRTRLDLYTEHDRPLTDEETASVERLVDRRAAREPLAYVLGAWGFRHLTLRTDARALVPRPETEVLVERALALLDGIEAPRVLDVGVGGGAVALALVQERPGAIVTATDVSSDALALARENADALGLGIELVHAPLLAGLAGPFHLVVSNPPYVRAEELASLEPEVRDWEPRDALLDEGQTEAIARNARGVLAARGALALEVHERHAGAVAALLAELGYHGVAVTRDLAGRDRVVEARWTP